MTIHTTVTIAIVKGGIAARSEEIELVGHGRDRDRAVSSLRSAVEVWARCLARDGSLEGALEARRVVFSHSGDGIVVEPRLVSVTA